MKKIITVSIAFLAIFTLTGCISKTVDVRSVETKIHQIDKKPFTIADADAFKLKTETESQEEITSMEEPIVITTTETKVAVETTEPIEVAFTEKPIVITATEPKVSVETTEPIEVAFTEKPIVIAATEPKVAVETTKPVEMLALNYYIQVVSLSKYAPSEKFLDSITDLGYTYKLHEVTNDSKTTTKVLVGPFPNATKAKDARIILRAKIEPGSFLIKL